MENRAMIRTLKSLLRASTRTREGGSIPARLDIPPGTATLQK